MLALVFGLNLLPARGFFGRGLADQVRQLQQVLLGAGGQGLRLAAVVVAQQGVQLLRRHQRRELRRQPRHVAVAALQLEGRRLAVAVVLRGRCDVGQVHFQ